VGGDTVLLTVTRIIVGAIELYSLAGLVFALLFLPRAVARLDPGMTAAPTSLRLLILPGTIAFWPLFARRWMTGAGEPIERNPHRVKAAGNRVQPALRIDR
jgi:hypothetical protein